MEDLGGNTQIVKDCGASVPSFFSPVLLFVTPWTRHEYWSGLPFLSLGDPPNSRIEPMSPAWQVVSLSLGHLEDCIKGIKYTERKLYMNAKNLWKISTLIFISVNFVTLHLI